MYGDKGEIPEGEYLIPIGKAEVKKKGDHITIVSFGKILKVVQEAVDVLEKEGVSCEVIDLRSVRPIDYDCLVESIKKTNRCFENAAVQFWSRNDSTKAKTNDIGKQQRNAQKRKNQFWKNNQ